MSSDDERLAELLERARQLAPTEREAFVRREVGNDAESAAELRTLLRNYDSAASVLDPQRIRGVIRDAVAEPAPTDADAPLPQRIGEFEILGVIGTGGFGVVYRALQDSPRREVALKVAAAGRATQRDLERLKYEGDVLARLEHECIARCYAVGIDVAGGVSRPYVAMELIHGEPLTSYLERAQPTLNERLRLLIVVARAVHFAHQRQVIHRDLKPGNILVDALGKPHILDFGIALSPVDMRAGETSSGGSDAVAGTLAYMSPEQAGADASIIDVRTDVYALGVIGFEALAGRRPHDFTGLSRAQTLARLRNEPAPRLAESGKRLRGDLDAIFAKALEIDPARRYESASALADDLQNHLDDRPVRARPAHATYVAGRFVRRHRALVGSSIGAASALIAGMALSYSSMRTALAAEKDTRDVLGFVREILWEGAENLGTEVPLHVVVERAHRRIDHSFEGRPRVEAEVRSIVAATLNRMGRFEAADSNLRNAVEHLRAVAPDDDPQLVLVRADQAAVERDRGRPEAAVGPLRDALEVLRTEFGERDQRTTRAYGNLAQALADAGEWAEALAIASQSRALEQELGLEEDALTSLGTIVQCLIYLDQIPEAETTARELHQQTCTLLGATSPYACMTATTMTAVLVEAKKFAQAEPYSAQAVTGLLQAYGEDNTETHKAYINRADVLMRLGRPAEAELLLRCAIDGHLDHFGPAAEVTIDAQRRLAFCRLQQDDPVEARAIYRSARRALAEDSRGDSDLARLLEERLRQVDERFGAEPPPAGAKR